MVLNVRLPPYDGVDSKSDVLEKGKNLFAQNVRCPEYGVMSKVVCEGEQSGPLDIVAGFLGRAQTEPLVVGHVEDEGPGPDPVQLIGQKKIIGNPVSKEQVVRVVTLGEREQQFSLVSIRSPAEDLFAGLGPGLAHAEVKAQSRLQQYRPSEHHTVVRVFFLGQMVVSPFRFPPDGVALNGRRHEFEEPAGAGICFR